MTSQEKAIGVKCFPYVVSEGAIYKAPKDFSFTAKEPTLYEIVTNELNSNSFNQRKYAPLINDQLENVLIILSSLISSTKGVNNLCRIVKGTVPSKWEQDIAEIAKEDGVKIILKKLQDEETKNDDEALIASIAKEGTFVCENIELVRSIRIEKKTSYEFRRPNGVIFTPTSSELSNKGRFASIVAEAGYIVDPTQLGNLLSYYSIYNRVILKSEATHKGSLSTGWKEDDKFLLPFQPVDNTFSDQTLIDPEGILEEKYQTKGAIEEELKVIDSMSSTTGFIAYLSALAVPLSGLFPSINQNWLLFLSGTSGTGKSTIANLSKSIFSNPESDRKSFSATLSALNEYLKMNAHLPTYIDETMEWEGNASDLVRFLYSVSNGEGKSRAGLTAYGVGLKKEESIFTSPIISSEETIENLISRAVFKSGDGSNPAGLHRRVISVRITKENAFNGMTRNKIDELVTISKRNYGNFGIKWIEYISKHRETLDKRFIEMDLEDLGGKEKSYKALILALQILREMNIVSNESYDIQMKLFDKMIKRDAEVRDAVLSPEVKFLSAIQDEVQSQPFAYGGDGSIAREQLGKINPDGKLIYFTMTQLNNFLKRNSLTSFKDSILENLKKQGLIDHTRKSDSTIDGKATSNTKRPKRLEIQISPEEENEEFLEINDKIVHESINAPELVATLIDGLYHFEECIFLGFDQTLISDRGEALKQCRDRLEIYRANYNQ